MSIEREIGKSIPNHGYLKVDIRAFFFSYVVFISFGFYVSYNCENEALNLRILN